MREKDERVDIAARGRSRSFRGLGALVSVLVAMGCASSGATPNGEPGADTAGPAAPPGLRADDDSMAPLVRRPVPAPVVPPPFFQRALDARTRSSDGSPGEAYWRNRAVYDIEASLDPATGRLDGRETIRYENRSPRDLTSVMLHLHQNLHAEGVVRGEAEEVTGGVELGAVTVDGRDATPGGADGPSYEVEGTLMSVRLAGPLEPGGEVELRFEWSFIVPQNGAGRMGWSAREMYFVGYWFPKVAVFDDVRGWDAEPYLGGAEFYDEFGDYDVRLTVPEGWTVMATGQLENVEEVYRPAVVERLEAAATADTVVAVVTGDDRAAGRVTVDAPDDLLTYRFRAEEVRDFAWTTSNVQRWDATSAVVPDRDGDRREDRVLIHSFWRADRAPLWSDQARYGKQSIEFHSRYTGLAYPWPHMTSVEGDDIIGGGMEYPMMTIIGAYRGREPADLFNVTSHELAHMWIPMTVGTNEKRYAWMDEGSTTFLENQSRREYYPDTDPDELDRQSWLGIARAGLEQPLMRHGDYYEPGPGYGTASYAKPASLLVGLRALLGRDTFLEAYHTFVGEWAFKHPTPWDLFNTFERFAGRDLDWWWTSFYYETWTLDHAVVGVETRPDDRRVIVVEDRGWAVAPAEVQVHTDRRTYDLTVPVRRWLEGHQRV
ncbi:MAG: M1 family metallopeptidase, partial [Gemmatimonadota bacterium]